MITYSSLGKAGNLGNQLFQVASTVGLAKKHRHDYFFPAWKYNEVLKNELPSGQCDETFTLLKETQFDYHQWPIGDGNYDLTGWLQTEKYFDIGFTKEMFAFKDELVAQTLSKTKYLFKKPTVLISVRRGDFIRNPGAYQLSYKYYFLALQEHFANHDDYNFLFTSDDIAYCKRHFSFIPNAIFLEGFDPIEQLIIAGNCNHYVISNSTFSWWAAWLGEKPDSKIIRPLKSMRGKAVLKYNDKDYFPERWIVFAHKGKRVGARHWKLFLNGEIEELYDTVRMFLKDKTSEFKKTVKKLIGR
jgi:hypothetical protein